MPQRYQKIIAHLISLPQCFYGGFIIDRIARGMTKAHAAKANRINKQLRISKFSFFMTILFLSTKTENFLYAFIIILYFSLQKSRRFMFDLLLISFYRP